MFQRSEGGWLIKSAKENVENTLQPRGHTLQKSGTFISSKVDEWLSAMNNLMLPSCSIVRIYGSLITLRKIGDAHLMSDIGSNPKSIRRFE
jgi:hypothetical protein